MLRETCESTAGSGVVLSGGEIGCALSHATAWHEVLERGWPFAVVLPVLRFSCILASAVATVGVAAD